MADLAKFIEKAVTGGLARVRLAGGGRVPFCLLELRSLHPESEYQDEGSVMGRTFGVRALAFDPDTQKYGNDANSKIKRTDAHLPAHYRLAVRPRNYGQSNRISVWHPTKAEISAKIEATDSANDVLAVPLRPLGKEGKAEVSLPGLRLAEGHVDTTVLLVGTGNTLARYFHFSKPTETLFDLATIDGEEDTTRPGKPWLWPVTISPDGIEFDSVLPDPTTALDSDAKPAEIIARVRLEVSETAADPGPVTSKKSLHGSHYRLRLIGPSKSLRADESQATLLAASARLARYFERLVDDEAPTRIRLDDRSDVPPLIWPLLETGAGLSRQIVPWETFQGSKIPRVEIDNQRIDIRLKTKSEHASARDGLARVNAQRIQILGQEKQHKKVTIDIRAGTDAEDPDALNLVFRKSAEESWVSTLDGTMESEPVYMNLTALRDRLTPLYQDAGLLDRPEDEAPYAFFALRDGWMQMPLPKSNRHEKLTCGDVVQPSASNPNINLTEPKDTSPTAISGRIVFAVRTAPKQTDGQSAATRALSIDEAAGLRTVITSNWAANNTEIAMTPNGATGRFLGFLFAADTSPSAREAVPTWAAGDAAAREVALSFGTGDAPDADFTLNATGKAQAWRLSWALGALNQQAPVFAWTAPDANPFITNYPMARTVPTAPVPALSRGLLPRQLTGKVHMLYEGSGADSTWPENELPKLVGDKDKRLPGTPVPSQPAGDGRPVKSLVLPTLNGVEFLPSFTVDPKKPDALHYKAVLRYDLPLLDELFAWSDPPPGDAEAADENDAKKDGAPEVTALYPDRMVEAWRLAEHRMRLTWTEDAVEDERIEIRTNGTGKGLVSFDTIAAPYSLERQVEVSLDETALFGRLSMDDQPNGLAGATVGLGGRVTSQDRPLEAMVRNGKLVPHNGDADYSKITITGYAADLFDADRKGKPEGYLSDARGTGLKPRANADGTSRSAQIRNGTGGSASNETFTLLTMPGTETIGSGDSKVRFYARDLPVKKKADALRFSGIPLPSEKNPKAPAWNPVEGRTSFDGQSYKADVMAKALYEWRCFPNLPPYGDDRLGLYEIPVGAFRFRPLRLANAVFTENGKLTSAAIVGSLSYRGDNPREDEHFAFGADRIYDRDDLFLMTLTPGAQQEIAFEGIAARSGPEGQIELSPRPRIVRLSRQLARSEFGLLKGRGSVDAEIALTFADTSLNSFSANLTARLFGSTWDLRSRRTTLDDKKIAIELDVPTKKADVPALLENVTLDVTLTPDGSGDQLVADGDFLVSALHDPSYDDPARLLRVTQGWLEWLDLTADIKSGGLDFLLDHETGVLTLTANGLATDQAAALFGLKPSGDVPNQSINGSFCGVFAPDSFSFATAHLLLTASQDTSRTSVIHNMIYDRARLAAGSAINDIEISWSTDTLPSPIRWPIGEAEVALDDGGDTLDQIAEGPLDPVQETGPKEGTQYRVLTLAAGGEALEHSYRLVLNRQVIASHDLERSSTGSLLPRRAIRTMAAVEHQLSGYASEAKKSVTQSWWSLDHITFTTAALMVDECETVSMVPRHSRKRRTRKPSNTNTLSYRSQRLIDDLPQGANRMGEANLAGWHDAGMRDFVWKQKNNADRVFVLGAAPLWMPHLDRERAQIAMLPWAFGFAQRDPMFQTGSTARNWRITTADAWSAHALKTSGRQRTTGLNSGMTAGDLAKKASDGGRNSDPGSLIPVESGFFEPWIGKDANAHPAPIDENMHPDAPYFLRAALALRARWRAGSDGWNPLTMVPRPSADANGAVVEVQPDDPALRLIGLRDSPQRVADQTPPALPADLVALSQDELRIVPGYRLVAASQAALPLAATATGIGDDPLVEISLVESARLTLADARVAARVIRPQTQPPSSLVHPVDDVPDPLSDVGIDLTDSDSDLGASPALGWPVTPEGLKTPILPVPAPALGTDMALQSPDSGFSGRAQRTQWPAAAFAETDPVSAAFATISQHVVFERGRSPFPFDGPGARHLSPAPTRRRAPLPHQQEEALDAPHTAPMTMPSLDKTVIGRRPGVMEISSAAMTVVQQRDETQKTALDQGWPGMGQAADSGPVVAHQVRTPRGTILPPDPHVGSVDTLRRRTYFSRADRLDDQLRHFGSLPGPQDAIRLVRTGKDTQTGKDAQVHWRISAGGIAGSDANITPSHGVRLGPDWPGTITIRLKAVTAKDTAEATAPTATPGDPFDVLNVTKGQDIHTVRASLQIGGKVFTANPIDAGENAVLHLSFAALTEAREALQAATPDTALSLSLVFPHSDETRRDLTPYHLDKAGTITMALPVTLDPGARRVVRTRMDTAVFGDPSYDRQLASETLSDVTRLKWGPYRLAVDRREYNSDSPLFVALSRVDEATGGFVPYDALKEAEKTALGTITFQRIQSAENIVTPAPQDLVLFGPDGPDKPRSELSLALAARARIGDLRDPATGRAPLRPGDTLVINFTADIDGEKLELSLRPRIVAAPVIAPPPSVYVLTETLRGILGRDVSRLRLHAASALPTRIEHPDLFTDLGRGHVRREGLFVWHYARPISPVLPSASSPMVNLVKLDRSGSAQLPEGS